MLSSMIRTVRCSGRPSCHTWPPPSHACLPAMHTPCHACPLPHMPPPTCMHAPLPCMPPHAMHVPALCAPLLCMSLHHACPPGTHAPHHAHPCHMCSLPHTPPAMHAPLCHECPLCHACPLPFTPPPVDRMTDACENITFPQLLLRTVIRRAALHCCDSVRDRYDCTWLWTK